MTTNKFRLLIGLLCLMVLPGLESAYSQEQPDTGERPPSKQETPPVPPGFTEMTTKNAAAPCLEPQKLPGMAEYQGPLKKPVGLFARALERGTLFSHPTYQSGLMLCTFGARDKFMLFLGDSLDPLVLLSAGFDAGIDQANNRDPTFGQGGAGYAKRFAAAYADRASARFFKDFFYPVLFSEDPRYYRLGQGPAGRRMLHATGHLFVAHHGDGQHVFNYSEWLGTATTVALSNFYHPGNRPGGGEMARRAGYQLGMDVGFDILREFWPEIARKLKLPFRGVSKPSKPGPEGAHETGR